MQGEPLQSLILHAQNILAAAEISSKQYAALQQHALEAESRAAACEAQHARTALNLQACQQQCKDLQQQLSYVDKQLAATDQACVNSKQQLKLANENASKAQQEVASLQAQLSSATQDQQQLRNRLQEQVQQLQAELVAAHSSRDLLFQQLQQQEAQLQELLDSTDAIAGADDGSDEELPITQYEDVDALSAQQQQQKQQQADQQHEIEVLKAQVCRLLDDNAVLQVRNESLDQQLGVSKMELARLQQQLAAAVQQLSGQQQAVEQQRQEQTSVQGAVVHDKAYYKRKYIEIKDRYDALKQQKRPVFSLCQATQANNPKQHDSSKARAGGCKRQHDTVAAAATVAAATAVISGAVASTLTKAAQQHTVLAAGQPSPSTAAAAARLAAAFTPPGKKRKGSRDTHAAAVAGRALIPASAATAAREPRAVSIAAQDAAAAATADGTQQHGGSRGDSGPGYQQQPQQPTPQQQQQQQLDSEQCEPTLPLMAGTDGSQEPVKLPEQQHRIQQHKQQQLQQQQQQPERQSHASPAAHPAAEGGSERIDVADIDAAGMEVAEAGDAQLVAAKHKPSNRQAASKQLQQQQQQSIGNRSPAWRAVRSTKGKAGAAAAVAAGGSRAHGSSRSSSTGHGSSPQEGYVQQQPQVGSRVTTAVALGSVDKVSGPAEAAAAAAGSDSDFNCPVEPKKRMKQQQQQLQLQGMQQKVAKKRGQLTEDCGTAGSLESEDEQQQQQQQQVSAHHGGRRRGVTPVPPPPPPQQQQLQQQQQENCLELEATLQDTRQQAVPLATEYPKKQLQMQEQHLAEGQAGKPVPPAIAAARSRYTMVCSKPVMKQHAALLPAAPHAAAGASGTAVHAGNTADGVDSELKQPAGNENKQPGSSHDYKYQEVVRKRAAREALNAFECDECKKFYTALQSWGAAGQLGLPTCGHAAPKDTAAAAGALMLGGAAAAAAEGAAASGGGVVLRQPRQTAVHQLVQNAGRHRAKWQPPSTPPGFWHIGFTPDHDSLESRQ